MAGTTEEKPEPVGRSIFLDVFRRADKTDDGALSLEEFKAFFSDGILSSEDLEKLFHDIDTHKTNNLDTSELCDYFMKEMGPFSEIFANLESMNRAVSNALVESAKEYPGKSFIGKFTTRFLLNEIQGQMSCLEHHINAAVDKIDEDETKQRPDVCQAEVTNVNIRGGRMKRKMHSFSQQTSLDASQQALRHGLSVEVDRLRELIGKLENKVKFDVIDEEEVELGNEQLVVLVSRKFQVHSKAGKAFRSNLKSYIASTSMAEGCLHLGVRTITGTNTFMVYEIWANSEDLNSHFSSDTSKMFMRGNIDHLEQPEEYHKMAVPASWWRGQTS
ncbi:N-terminal EF-hand calcium-binding protein 1-like isoform X2 [Porites lutea]|uniref:N-terminal EF-hand calcium-binding protein 1-like isoform X2 n=1 Tax=Porites lutea TaxID=51062 RepID=UPI003CC537E2